MITIILVLASLVIGFSWGFVLTFKYMVLPARAQTKKVIDMTIANLEKQKEMILSLLTETPTVEADGSMLSPLQIKRD